MFAAISGFSVQIAQSVGADDELRSEKIFRHGIVCMLLLTAVIAAAGALIGGYLPYWLGADDSIAADASVYFMITICFVPLTRVGYLAGGALEATGNIRLSASMDAISCILDMFFNSLLIFPSGMKHVFGHEFYWPGAGLGVAGAALGTVLSEVVLSAVLLYFAAFRTRYLKISFGKKTGFEKQIIKTAARIAMPAALQQVAVSGAMVMQTSIIAPLGNIAIAANSFAVTAESVCYMPGFGLQIAASTLVGQSVGAGRKEQAKSFAWISTGMGMIIMAALGALMYFACPFVFGFLTPVAEVQALGIKVLRLELMAEPFYGASIVAAGALRGAGDTLIPGIMSFASIWGVRITLALLLVHSYGLYGVWIAMTAELVFRGIIFLLRLKFGKWAKALDEQE